MPNRTVALAVLSTLALPLGAQTRAEIHRAESAVTAADLLRDIRALSSDAFAGRAPGTRGEDSAVAWISDQFRRIGLAPGMPDGYVQTVPLLGVTSTLDATARV